MYICDFEITAFLKLTQLFSLNENADILNCSLSVYMFILLMAETYEQLFDVAFISRYRVFYRVIKVTFFATRAIFFNRTRYLVIILKCTEAQLRVTTTTNHNSDTFKRDDKGLNSISFHSRLPSNKSSKAIFF